MELSHASQSGFLLWMEEPKKLSISMTSDTYFPPYLRYTEDRDYKTYEEFKTRFHINTPERFNFAYDVVGELAKTHPDMTALLYCDDQDPDDSTRYSFRDMDERSDQAAAFFLKCGIGKGDRVMLILRRRAEFWFAVLGLHKIGAIAVPATHLLTSNDIVYRVEYANIRMIMTVDAPNLMDHMNEAASRLKEAFPKKVLVHKMGEVVPEGWISFNHEIKNLAGAFRKPAEKDLPTNEDPMLIYFTSGTTGHPKMVSHNFLYPLGHIVTARYWQCVKTGGLHLTLADTGWAKAAWGKIYGQWLAACTVVAYDFDRFNPKRLIEVIRQHKVTSFCAPPTVYRFLIREKLDPQLLPDLEHCTVAGEPLNPEVYNAFLKKTGLRLHEGYGQTELSLVVGTFVDMKPRAGSMGKPAPLWDVLLVDEDDKECEPGEPGEIVIRIPEMPPAGFLIDPSFEEHRASGKEFPYIYRTGDVAQKDEDGYYWFIGRNDDIIKSSGYRIGPFEVENALIEHPSVVECAVTGVPHSGRGHAIKATVVLAEGIQGSLELIKELQMFVKGMTASYKTPRIIEFVKELPKTISGKIRRIEIKRKS